LINITLSCDNKLIKESKSTKNLGIDTDSCLSWKNVIDEMMVKLGTAWYKIRYDKHFMYKDTLRTIYISYLHSIKSYGIFFGVIMHAVLINIIFIKG